jgi:hypothetical protein
MKLQRIAWPWGRQRRLQQGYRHDQGLCKACGRSRTEHTVHLHLAPGKPLGFARGQAQDQVIARNKFDELSLVDRAVNKPDHLGQRDLAGLDLCDLRDGSALAQKPCQGKRTKEDAMEAHGVLLISRRTFPVGQPGMVVKPAFSKLHATGFSDENLCLGILEWALATVRDQDTCTFG